MAGRRKRKKRNQGVKPLESKYTLGNSSEQTPFDIILNEWDGSYTKPFNLDVTYLNRYNYQSYKPDWFINTTTTNYLPSQYVPPLQYVPSDMQLEPCPHGFGIVHAISYCKNDNFGVEIVSCDDYEFWLNDPKLNPDHPDNHPEKN